MTYGLADLVLENCNNPGTGTINLGGAPTGRLAFVQGFSSGARAYYYLTDGTQNEWGLGTVTAGSPNTLSRDTVYGNSAGTTALLNFTGACQVYNDSPASRTIVADLNNAVALSGQAIITDPGTTAQFSLSVSATGNTAGGVGIKLTGNGATTPSKFIRAYGGGLDVLNSAYTITILHLDDTGNQTLTGSITASHFTGGGDGGSTIGFASNNGITSTNYGSGASHLVFRNGVTLVGYVYDNGSSTSYYTSSDYRIKTILGYANSGDIIDGVRVHHATMGGTLARPMMLAHELQIMVPDVVRGDKDAVDADGNPVLQHVDYMALIPVLWNEAYWLRRRAESAEARLAAIEAKLGIASPIVPQQPAVQQVATRPPRRQMIGKIPKHIAAAIAAQAADAAPTAASS